MYLLGIYERNALLLHEVENLWELDEEVPLLLHRLYKGAMASSCKKERKKETKPKICASFQLF